MSTEERAHRLLPPGTKVRRKSLSNGVDAISQYGMAVHCWAKQEIMRYRLATADAVVYATAQAWGADIVTCDARFDGLPRVLFVAPIDA